MTTDPSKTMFKQALLDSVVNYYSDTPSEAMAPDTVCLEKPRQSSRRVMRTLICAAILVSTLICTAVAVSYEEPEQVGLQMHCGDDRHYFTADTSDMDELPDALSPYCPNYVPSGYSLSLSLMKDSSVVQFYEAEDGGFFSYDQHLLNKIPENEYGFAIYGSDVTVTQRTIGGMLTYVLTDDSWGDTNIVWASDEYIYFMKFYGELSWDEIDRIVKSIRPCASIPTIVYN